MLILDHTAWLHGQTHFAQGQCELGMKVKFKQQVASGSSGGRAGFYIGMGNNGTFGAGQNRTNTFGDPLEMELGSSNKEGEDGEGQKSNGDDV